MKTIFNKIILSSNENPKYIQFWPLVSWAWKILFNVDVYLAFVTNRTEDDSYIDDLKKYGNVTVFPEIKGIPSSNNAKMARHYLASTFENDVCLINDIDLLPLQREYVLDIEKYFINGHILCVGSDVYVNSTEEGKFPIGYMMAQGKTFKQILNPYNLSYEDLLNSFIGFRVFDHKEDISRDIYHEDPDTFSDESLFRALIHKWNNKDFVINIPRGFNPYTERAIDRASWQNDAKKLYSGVYVEAHLSRPFDSYIDQFKPLIAYIKECYENK